jgi:hypothetical protein
MENPLKNLFKKLYHALPVIRELHKLEVNVNRGVSERLRSVQESSIVQALEAIKASNPRYSDPQRLLAHGAQYWSQNYEDGMIAEIFHRIGSTSKTFLEIGIGDGRENNTAGLIAMGWSGCWIDGSKKSCDGITVALRTTPAVASRLKVRQAFVSPENVTGLLEELGVPAEVDLFSLDIDLDTYHVWAALKQFRPRVVVVEYNAAFPPKHVWIHPYQPGKVWDGTQNFSASLKAFEQLGRERGYSLVGCDIIGINAFFVRNDLVGDKFAAPFTAENHNEPPRYHLVLRSAHPSSYPFFEDN